METERLASRRALVILAILAVCLAAALPLFAEDAAPQSWHLLRQSSGLELRDPLNRPISREALKRELRGGVERVRRAAADLSCLPGLRRWLDYMERALLWAGLRPERPWGPSRRAALVQRPPRAPKPRLLTVRPEVAPGLEASPLSPWVVSHPSAPGLPALQVLRL